MAQPLELRACALQSLLESDPAAKTAGVAALAAAHAAGRSVLDVDAVLTAPDGVPGRPARPVLVPPRLVGQRSMATVEGRAMLVHALTHIEFNAVKIRLEYWIRSHYGKRPCLSLLRTPTFASRLKSSPRATH